MIDEIQYEGNKTIYDILDRVKGIDINPLAVLTCRVNYFISISHLIENEILE
jgi:hypothetical protein